VGNVLDLDHLEQSFADLETEFSNVLDQDNPLSSRYLRTFPRATVFGWTRTAPGEKARSEYSLPYHLAHLSRLMDDRKEYFVNPVGKLSPESAARYANVLIGMLERGNEGNRCKINSETCVDAWLCHGGASSDGKSYPYSFCNDDLEGYLPMDEKENPLLKELKDLDCLFKHARDETEILDGLDRILKDERRIGYAVNSIWEFVKRLKEKGNINLLQKVEDRLRNSLELNNFLMRKLARPELGLLRKIDYYMFYQEVVGERNDEIEDLIRSKALKRLMIPLRSDRDYDRRDYQHTLIKSLIKNKLFTQKELLKQLVGGEKVLAHAVTLATQIIRNYQSEGNKLKDLLSEEEMSELVLKLMDSVKMETAGPYLLKEILSFLTILKNYPTESEEIIEKILVHKDRNDEVLAYVIDLIEDQKDNLDAQKYINKILFDKKAGQKTVEEVFEEAEDGLPEGIKNIENWLERGLKFIDHEDVFWAMLDFFEDYEYDIPNALSYLEKIADSNQADDDSLEDVIEIIPETKLKLSLESKLSFLEKMKSHPKVGDGSLSEILEAVIEINDENITDYEQLMDEFLNHPKAGYGTGLEVLHTIQYHPDKFSNPFKYVDLMWKKYGSDNNRRRTTTLGRILYVLDELNVPVQDKFKYISRLFKNIKTVDENEKHLAEHICSQSPPYTDNQLKIIMDEIFLDSSQKKLFGMMAFASCLTKRYPPPGNFNYLMDKIVEHSNIVKYGDYNILTILSESRFPIDNIEKYFSILSTRFEDEYLDDRINFIEAAMRYPFEFKNRDKIVSREIKKIADDNYIYSKIIKVLEEKTHRTLSDANFLLNVFSEDMKRLNLNRKSRALKLLTKYQHMIDFPMKEFESMVGKAGQRYRYSDLDENLFGVIFSLDISPEKKSKLFLDVVNEFNSKDYVDSYDGRKQLSAFVRTICENNNYQLDVVPLMKEILGTSMVPLDVVRTLLGAIQNEKIFIREKDKKEIYEIIDKRIEKYLAQEEDEYKDFSTLISIMGKLPYKSLNFQKMYSKFEEILVNNRSNIYRIRSEISNMLWLLLYAPYDFIDREEKFRDILKRTGGTYGTYSFFQGLSNDVMDENCCDFKIDPGSLFQRSTYLDDDKLPLITSFYQQENFSTETKEKNMTRVRERLARHLRNLRFYETEKNKGISEDVMLTSLALLNRPLENEKILLLNFISDPFVGPTHLITLSKRLRDAKHEVPSYDQILEGVFLSPVSNEEVHLTVLESIEKSTTPLVDPLKLLNKMISSKNTTEHVKLSAKELKLKILKRIIPNYHRMLVPPHI